MATGLFGTSVGLDQLEKFRVQSESATGLETLSAHFPPGEAQPIWIITDSEAAGEVAPPQARSRASCAPTPPAPQMTAR
jgi:RND superfamily putative drug exporter